jgi:hypothetical protein
VLVGDDQLFPASPRHVKAVRNPCHQRLVFAVAEVWSSTDRVETPATLASITAYQGLLRFPL